MADSDRERLLADLLEDFHRRRALGERPAAEDYRERAGETFPEFEQILAAEAALDAAMDSREEPSYPFPFGEYTILRELGRGGAGVVYEAVQRGLGRKVALKVLRTGFDTQPVAIERFRREARACAQLRHDNIIEVYDAGEHGGRPYYAMALLEGTSLAQLIRQGELPPEQEIAAAAADIAGALQLLHDRGIVHRDVKPSNIMVEPSGRWVLADFGLARTVEAEALTQTGESLGTPLYMSPEQLLGKKEEINGRTDVYCLGATLYEALSRQPVYKADDVRALMRMILAERPKSLGAVATNVSPEIECVVMKALEKRNDDRYESAAAMSDDLMAVSRGEPVAGRPLSSLRHALRRLRRHTPAIAGVAALVVAGVILATRPSPARLSIASVPPSQVILDEEERGETPVAVEVEPGTHRLVLRREGYHDRSRTLELESGAKESLELLMRPLDPGDPEAVGRLAEAFELAMEDWEEMEVTRSGPGEDRGVYPLFPRGQVRVEDLEKYRLQLGNAFDGTGKLVFRDGGRLLYSRVVNENWPLKTDSIEEIPAEVKAALLSGAKVTWGFEPEDGEPVTASFSLGGEDLASKLAAIESRLEDHDPLVVKQLRAQLLLEGGFAFPAYREAREVARTAEYAPRAYAIMKAALTELELTEGPPWEELKRISVTKKARRRTER